MSRTKHGKHKTEKAAPSASEDTSTILRETNAVVALSALYQGEKIDASSVFNTAMAMMGIAVAYLVAATPFVGTLSRDPLAWLFLAILPLPLWLVIAFHSLVTLNAMSHGISVRIVEDALFYLSEVEVVPIPTDRNLVGSAAGDRIMDITQSSPVHKLTTKVVYGGVVFLALGFSVYALLAEYHADQNHRFVISLPAFWVAIAVYSFLLLMVGRSWFVGFRRIHAGRDECRSYEVHWQTLTNDKRRMLGLPEIDYRRKSVVG